MKKLPRWSLYAVGVLVVLVVPLIVVLMTAPDSSASKEAAGGAESPEFELATIELTEEQAARVDLVCDKIRAGEIGVASSEFTNSFGRRFPVAGFPRVLQALKPQLADQPTRRSLRLYADVLTAVINERAELRDLEFHVRSMRYLALALGDKELLGEVAESVYTADRLPRLYDKLGASSRAHLDVVSYFITFERWRTALEVLQRVSVEGALETENWDTRLAGYRMAARISGASELPEAEQFLATQITRIRAREDTEEAEQLVLWLRGVERFYSPDRRLDRGSRSIAKALGRNALAFGETQFRLDYVRALREEANLRESRLRSEYVSLAQDRGRRLFLIGWGAARLGDIDELRVATVRLAEDTGTQRGRAYLPLLRGVSEIMSGQGAKGEQHILEGLRRSPGLLQPGEEAQLREVASTHRVPEARDRGRIYVTTGKIWADLDQREWLARTQERLRRELSSPADLAYLSFLEAISAYRDHRVEGATDKLLALLDGPSYADLSRQEIAGLLVLAEERGKELERIDKRRQLALATLDGLKLTENRPEGSLARIVRWQIRRDQEGPRYILSAEGDVGFAALDEVLVSSWLEFPLEEKRLELQQDLVAVSQRLREEGNLVQAREALDRSRSLVRDHPLYHREEAQILTAMAKATDPDQEQVASDLFEKAGDAFLKASTSSFGFPELYFEATESYLAAGRWAQAFEAAKQYTPTELEGATANARYWGSLMHRLKIHRQLQNYPQLERLVEENVDRHEAGLHGEHMLYQRALGHEARGMFDEALADYDRIYSGLLSPTSQVWQDSLYRRATILNDRLQSADGSDGNLPSLEQETLELWEELAAWMDERSGTGDLAMALNSAGEIRLSRGDYPQARRHFRRLIGMEQDIASLPMARNERVRWNSMTERGRFSLADSYYQAGDYEQASHLYREAVGRHPESANVPYGYYQLGECQRQQGKIDAAIDYYELGKRRVDELAAGILDDLPPRRGKAFWRSAFQKQIRALKR